MRYFSVFLILIMLSSLGACDWLMEDSDKDSVSETTESGEENDPGDKQPGGGITDY